MDEFNEFLKLLSMAQRAEDKDFDTSRVMLFKNFALIISKLSTLLNLHSFQLHPKERAPILHECLYCSAEFTNRPSLLVSFICHIHFILHFVIVNPTYC